MDEREAIVTLKRGDLHGLEVLVGRYYLQAVRAAYLIVQDTGQAEDIVQTAFITASQKIAQLSSDRFGPWFLRIVIHASIKAAEKQKRLVPLDEETEEAAQSAAKWLLDPSPTPETMVETDELRRDVWNAIGTLTPEQRAGIVLRYYLDMSEVEMAAEFNLPRSTIKWRLYAAREKLRALLSPFRADALPAGPPKTNTLPEKQD